MQVVCLQSGPEGRTEGHREEERADTRVLYKVGPRIKVTELDPATPFQGVCEVSHRTLHLS